MYTYVHTIAISEKKIPWILRRVEKSIQEGLKGRKGQEKCCNYVMISKIKRKNDPFL